MSTLPIRNGNSSSTASINFFPFLIKGEYLTYKEWEQSGGLNPISIAFINTNVSTLPIRNGNFIAPKISPVTLRPGEYLTYKEWKPTYNSYEDNYSDN